MMVMWGDLTDDVLTILSLVLTIVGFGITIYNVVRAKRAAKYAQDAVDEVREDILRIDMVAEFSSALAAMDEIKRLHRQKAWDVLPDRYAALRRSLVEIRSANPNLPEHHKVALQSSIVRFRGFESQIEEALVLDEKPSNVAKLNETISEQVDDLQAILTEVKTQIGA